MKTPFSFRLHQISPIPQYVPHYGVAVSISAVITIIVLQIAPRIPSDYVILPIVFLLFIASNCFTFIFLNPPRRKEHPLPIHGTDAFKLNINHILNELQLHAPKRYREAISYLPQADFILESSIKTPIAESRGIFHIDGSGNKQSVNDSYELLRLAFIYEVGAAKYYYHNEIINTEGRDRAAKQYCHTVLRELGVEK